MSFRIACGLLAIGVGLLTGCGTGEPKLVPVQGKVRLGDKPLTTGFVIFHPDTSRGNTSKEEPRGDIDAAGNYVLVTHVNKGAASGWYRVTISAADRLDPNNPYFTKWLAPQKYIDPKTSGLTVQVVADPQPGAYDFQLDPR